MTSVLEIDYVAPVRPYSQDELMYMRQKLYHRLRLGKMRAHHQQSGYFYLVKQNGKKEKEMKEKSTVDVGNCSVSWKIGKTPVHLRNVARQLVQSYMDAFNEEPEYLTYSLVDLEIAFYTWLYEDFN